MKLSLNEAKFVKRCVSPKEMRYISIYYYYYCYYYYYYYYSVPFQSFILRHLVFVPTATTRNYQKNVRVFFPFHPTSLGSIGWRTRELSVGEAQFRLNRPLKYPETLVTTSLPEKIQAVTYWCQGSFFRLRPCCST